MPLANRGVSPYAHLDTDNGNSSLIVSEAMLEEEQKMKASSDRLETQRRVELEKQREQDLNAGAVDKDAKFKSLKFLLDKSQVYAQVMMNKMAAQQKKAEEIEAANLKDTDKDSNMQQPSVSANETKQSKCGKLASKNIPSRSKVKGKTGLDISDYFKKDELQAKAAGKKEAPESSQNGYQTKKTAFGDQELRSARQPDLVTGGVMRSYQLEGLDWLKTLYENGLNGILADEMGLGKTIQTISLLAFLREMGTTGPFLVAAPLSTLSNWVEEFRKWTPSVPVVLYHGTIAEREQIRKNRIKGENNQDFPVVCTSYEICMNDRKYLANFSWKYIIIDEGHRLKNLNSRLIRELKSYKSANRLLITGTPLQNNLTELWSLLNFLMPEIFDKLESFESWFDFSALKEKDGHKQILDDERQSSIISTLHAILKPFLLRRVKTDVETNLPKKREYILYAPMSVAQQELYREIVSKDGDCRRYLENKVMERLVKEQTGPSILKGNKGAGAKRKSSSGAATPNKSAKSSRASTPSSSSARVRRVKRKNYQEISDSAWFAQQDQPSESEELDEDEEEELERSKAVSIAKREIANKKLQNPIMQLRLTCNSPHNFYWPWPNGIAPDQTLITESGKMILVDRLVSYLHERGHKVLIFSQFQKTLDIIEDWATLLKGWNVCRIDGSVAQEDRRLQIKSFNHDPEFRIFLLSTRAGGQGINLTAADTVILFDSDWNPQQDLQAQDRAHRIGQTQPVIVYRLATKGTVEQDLLEKADAKRKLEKLVIRKGKFRGLGGAGKRDIDDMDELSRILTNPDFERFETGDLDGKSILSDHDLARLTDRSEEAYARAEKGLDRGKGFKAVETRADGEGLLAEISR
ncbi:MAG: hypothetical protein M1829_005515 [Trizodia sp. TS-e1964]|nr:MAG: hypothetical protein M1829_005515 [Trizodia sp. TS-e1964]